MAEEKKTPIFKKEELAKDTRFLIDTFIAKFTYIHHTKTCEEKLNQEKFPFKKKVKSIMDLPNYFDKSKYITESVKFDVAKIIAPDLDIIKHPVNYAQECRKKYKPHDITRCKTVEMLP